VIARRNILAREDDVAERCRIGRPPTRHAAAIFEPMQRAGQGQRASYIEPQREVEPGAVAGGNLGGREPPAGAGISWTAIPMGSSTGARDLGLDLASCAKAGVEDPHFAQPVEGGEIVVEMLRLSAHRPVPIEAEPGQIFEDCGGIFLAATGPVDILDAQQQAPSVPPRRTPAF